MNDFIFLDSTAYSLLLDVRNNELSYSYTYYCEYLNYLADYHFISFDDDNHTIHILPKGLIAIKYYEELIESKKSKTEYDKIALLLSFTSVIFAFIALFK